MDILEGKNSMEQNKDLYIDEIRAVYTGPQSLHWAPILAGRSCPDPAHEIQRSLSGFYVFGILLKGRGTVQQGDELYEVSEGDAYILRQGYSHRCHSDSKCPCTQVWFQANGSLVRHLLADYNLESTVVFPNFTAASHLQNILHILLEDPVHSGDRIALELFQHIQALASHIQEPAQSYDPALMMKDFIDQNLASQLTIESIAAHVHLSRSRALHVFKDMYGISPYNYYVKLRLELLQTMLQHTDLSMNEISEQLNFATSNHLSSFFKRYMGISPTQYRKQKGNA